MIKIRQYNDDDLKSMISIWNEVVDAGNAFPQEEKLNPESGKNFFASQSYCGVAENVETNEIYGLYILHPNNIGRCGHISNASYAVRSEQRGKHVGEALVKDCLNIAAETGFRILQFNAVVSSNLAARKLYEKLGFTGLGTIKNGFRMKDGTYEDICPYYIELKSYTE